MSVGTTIKALRKERELTQEQLAEYLSISPQAISQWETDKSAPDVYQIPVLARLFNVSADVILEINTAATEEEIKEFLKQYAALHSEGRLLDAFDLTMKVYRKYPGDFRVIDKYMWELFYDPNHHEEPFGEEVHKEELDKLCELVIRDCTDQQVRYTAYSFLSVLCLNRGDFARAEEICGYFPESYWDTKTEGLEQLYLRIDDQEKFSAQLRQNIHFAADHFINKLRNLGTFAMSDPRDKITVCKKCIAFMELVYDDEIIGFPQYLYGDLHCKVARYLWLLGEQDEALHYMEKGLAYDKLYDDSRKENPNIVHHGLVFEGVKEDLNDVFIGTTGTTAALDCADFMKMAEGRDLPKEFHDLIAAYTQM